MELVVIWESGEIWWKRPLQQIYEMFALNWLTKDYISHFKEGVFIIHIFPGKKYYFWQKILPKKLDCIILRANIIRKKMRHRRYLRNNLVPADKQRLVEQHREKLFQVRHRLGDQDILILVQLQLAPGELLVQLLESRAETLGRSWWMPQRAPLILPTVLRQQSWNRLNAKGQWMQHTGQWMQHMGQWMQYVGQWMQYVGQWMQYAGEGI